jgi:hypothetical protein
VATPGSTDAQADDAPKGNDSDSKRAAVFSPVPKVNLSTLKKKSAAGRNRHNHQQHPRTLIIPHTVHENDNENPEDASIGTDNANKQESNVTIPSTPKVSLRCIGSGMLAPEPQPPAYTASYAPPPAFADHVTANINVLNHSQLSQVSGAFPPPSPAHIRHSQAFGRVGATGSPHPAAMIGLGMNPAFAVPLHAPHSGAYMNPNAHSHDANHVVYGRPPTPAAHMGHRSQREKRSNTEESEQDNEVEAYRGRTKRSRMQLTVVNHTLHNRKSRF